MEAVRIINARYPASAARLETAAPRLLLCRGGGGWLGGVRFSRCALACLPAGSGTLLQLDGPAELMGLDMPAYLSGPAQDRGVRVVPDIPPEAESFFAAAVGMLEVCPSPLPAAVQTAQTLLLWFGALDGRAAPAPGNHQERIVLLAGEYIRTHYAAPLTLEQVAETLYVNPCYLSRIFHRQMGVSFRAYLRTVRLEAAADILARTNQLITDVALQTGFGSTSHFVSCFRQAYGVTPNVYRARRRQTGTGLLPGSERL